MSPGAVRWCDGPCGRELALEAYRPPRGRQPSRVCLDCQAAKRRIRRRVRYRQDMAERERRSRDHRGWYLRHREDALVRQAERDAARRAAA
jgi:hypothetical protein